MFGFCLCLRWICVLGCFGVCDLRADFTGLGELWWLECLDCFLGMFVFFEMLVGMLAYCLLLISLMSLSFY